MARSLSISKKDRWRKEYILWSIIISSTYGLTDEIHQFFVPGRFLSFIDWLADILGVVIFVWIYKWYKKNVLDRILQEPNISAEALYYLGVSSETARINGNFFNLTTPEEPSPPALDSEAARQIWEVSKAIRGLK